MASADVLSYFNKDDASSSATATSPDMTSSPSSASGHCGCNAQDMADAVEDYLNDHPEAVFNAMVKYREQKQAEEQEAVGRHVDEHADLLFAKDQKTVIGKPDAPIVVVEFMDYQCGHCRDMGETIEQFVSNNPDVRVVVREFPIFGGQSLMAAKAALVAADQGKFAEFHAALMNAPMPLTEKKIDDIAEKLGMDVAALQKAMNQPDINKQIRDNFMLARALKINATPAFVVGDGQPGHAQFRLGAMPPAALEVLVADVRHLQEKASGHHQASVNQSAMKLGGESKNNG